MSATGFFSSLTRRLCGVVIGSFRAWGEGEGALSSAAKETFHPTHYPSLHMLFARCSVLKAGVLGPRCWASAVGCWVLGAGCRDVGVVSWVLYLGSGLGWGGFCRTGLGWVGLEK